MAVAVTSWFEPLAGFGAMIAWVMHIQHDKDGGDTTASYNTFFYMSSVMVGLCALVVLALAKAEHEQAPHVHAHP